MCKIDSSKIKSVVKLKIKRFNTLDGSFEVYDSSEPLNLSYDSFYLLVRFHEVDTYERIDGDLVRFTYSLFYA